MPTLAFQNVVGQGDTGINDVGHSTTTTTTAPELTLSTGIIVGVAIAGSAVLMLLVGPILIQVAKWQDRQRAAAACPVSSLSFAEHGVPQIPRRLQKRGSALGHFELSYGSKRGGRVGRRLSLPVLPPVFSRPPSFNFGIPFSGSRNTGDGRGNDSSRSGSMVRPPLSIHAPSQQQRTRESAEKLHGYTIYQQRRKASWIDEDALHGPRISPSRSEGRASWLSGRGIRRTLSRQFSLRRHGASGVTPSPTLPCTETGQGREILARESAASLENRGIVVDGHKMGQSAEVVEIRGHLHVNPHEARVRLVQQRLPRMPATSAARPGSQSRREAVLEAAEQLAGRARVPSVEMAANGTQSSRLQHSRTDTELQAILRRTAEKLSDGTRGARRQTAFLPTPTPTPTSPVSRLPGQVQADKDPVHDCATGYARSGDMTPSPAKSQRSAPAVILHAEPERMSPGTNLAQGTVETSPLPLAHRRTYTRQISQVSQASFISEPDSLAMSPSRPGSQLEAVTTALTSPSRMGQTLRQHQQALEPPTCSPASDLSSALSTVYSEEEEGCPPIRALRLDGPSKRRSEVERRAMTRAQRVCDALHAGQVRKVEEEGVTGTIGNRLLTRQSPRPLHIRKGTLGQVLPDSVTGGSIRETPRSSPKNISTFTVQSPKSPVEDPFTAHSTPARSTAPRLSQVFSPLPSKSSGRRTGLPGQMTGPSTVTPTPSPTYRRVIPPPHRLHPGQSPATSGHYQEPEQIQTHPPSRRPSPVPSERESRLSSVYDSYRYSRYSDVAGGSQAPQKLAPVSGAPVPAVPDPEASPTKNKCAEGPTQSATTGIVHRDRENGNAASIFRGVPLRLNTTVAGPRPYPPATSRSSLPTVQTRPVQPGHMASQSLPHAQPHRDISIDTVSGLSTGSVYSQDEQGDTLAPLTTGALATARSAKQTAGITNTVAELRRMNSQVSSVSGCSTITVVPGREPEAVSPTLPALRGGGCSPGRKGAGGGAKNYLSLGSSPGKEEARGTDGEKRSEAGGERNENIKPKNNQATREKSVGDIHGIGGASEWITLRRGSARKSRRNTAMDSFENDLDHARRALRESRGLNLQAFPDTPKKSPIAGALMTSATKLAKAGKHASIESLGLYDEKGFLKGKYN
ncbi:hypothetical protein GGS20DRAFT_513098 [Poronia punctata]|nr:hypothetical protein GGS20DRAFT_513098 [Poronia punctata]